MSNRAAYFDAFDVTTFDAEGARLIDTIGPVSYDAAREIGRTNASLGYQVRATSRHRDWCMVWSADGFEAGTFAETTRVRQEVTRG